MLGAGKRGDGPPGMLRSLLQARARGPGQAQGPHVTTAVPRAVPGGAGRRAAGTCAGRGVELLPRLFRGWNIPSGAEAARGAAGAGGDPPGTAGRQQPVARGAHGGGTQRGPGRSRALGPPPALPGDPQPWARPHPRPGTITTSAVVNNLPPPRPPAAPLDVPPPVPAPPRHGAGCGPRPREPPRGRRWGCRTPPQAPSRPWPRTPRAALPSAHGAF